jgi:polar amino acid transport system ATP-binding protein
MTLMVAIRSVTKSYGNLKALDDVSIDVAAGEVVAVIGPSGSGKSTLLRSINQLEVPDRGGIWIDGILRGYCLQGDTLRALLDAEIARQRLASGMVFQRFNLFAHMTVAKRR